MNHTREEKEPEAATDSGSKKEKRKTDFEDPGPDGKYLIGYRSETGDKDNPEVVFRKKVLNEIEFFRRESGDIGEKEIADQIPGRETNQITGRSADDGPDRGDSRKAQGLVRPRQAQGEEQNIRRYGEKRRFRKREEKKGGNAVRCLGPMQNPIIESSHHQEKGTSFQPN